MEIQSHLSKQYTYFAAVVIALAVVVGCSTDEVTDRLPSGSLQNQSENTTTTNGPQVQTISSQEFLSWINAQEDWLLIDFWATWCGPCVEKFPKIVELEQQYRDRGLRVVSLSLDDHTDSGKVNQFFARQQANFQHFLTSEDMSQAFENLRLTALPEIRIFAPGGALVKKFEGETDIDEIKSALNEHLK